MGETTERLVRRLNEESGRTLSFFQAMTPDQWSQTVYTDGGAWKVRQVLAHIAAAEYSMVRLIENVLSGGAGTPEGFDLDSYNEQRVSKLQDHSPDDLMQQFAELRRETVELVSKLDDVDLKRRGRHPFLGIAPLDEIIQLMYRHTAIHQREIRKVLGK